jgi:hypothetical protein
MKKTITVSALLLFLSALLVNCELKAQDLSKFQYQPVENGFRRVGSRYLFNRALYGSHENDSLTERYVTFASDQPILMGIISDWRKSESGNHAKCGTFMAGFAISVGSPGETRESRWLHEHDNTVATYRNGWMEYEISTYVAAHPGVIGKMEVLPLVNDDGFLVSFKLNTNQKVNFVIGFGGITDFLGRLEFPTTKERNFSSSDCIGNTVVLGKNRALVSGSMKNSDKTNMWIGSSFPINVQVGDAKNIEFPGLFLKNEETSDIESPMVRMNCAIMQGDTLNGYIVVLRNAPESALDKWLSHPDPVGYIKGEIRKVQSAMAVSTPDHLLDLTIPPCILGVDAAWHHNGFYHGTYTWHTPYLGWRTWYGPTVLGWHDRVKKAFKTFADVQVAKSNSKEEVVFDGKIQMSTLKNSYGYLPDMPNKKDIFYNMQEVGVDMILHDIDWTGDLSYANNFFSTISEVLGWEKRILDADNDYLYQNWLNTWVSDAHSYNGGGCAQSSEYNYRANNAMAIIAAKTGKDPALFIERGKKIHDAVQKTLWIPEKGIMAEYIDVIGNKLLHPSPELATIYHSIESGIVDNFQAYQMLKFTETELRNERTPRGGRLVWSSNWYPSIYSSCGIYAAENIHLALAYFMNGQTQKGYELLTSIVDANFLNRVPGAVGHIMGPDGYSDGTTDFTDITSMYLRLIVEGLYGIQFNLLNEKIMIAPNFPADWDRADLRIPDATLEYRRSDQNETYFFESNVNANRVFSIPLRSTRINSVLLNGKATEYRIEPGIGSSRLIVESREIGSIKLEVKHSSSPLPKLIYQQHSFKGDSIKLLVENGKITQISDPSKCFNGVRQTSNTLSSVNAGIPGNHTVFVRIKQGEWDAWLPADIVTDNKSRVIKVTTATGNQFKPIDIVSHFNVSLEDIHKLEYWNPRPKTYSIMTNLNGRFGWDWNYAGFCKVVVDDSKLRSCGGEYVTEKGIRFLTPDKGNNTACVSIWKNFPDETRFRLSGKGKELAVFFIGVTNPMQSRVENGRFTVEYTDGSQEKVSLINPDNFDDWLVPSIQLENDTQYFSDYNHGIIQHITLNPSKELKALTVRAVANEVIIGILGISIYR